MYRTDRGFQRSVAAKNNRERANAAPASHERVRYDCVGDVSVEPSAASIRSNSRYARCAEKRISLSGWTMSSKSLRSRTMLVPSPITNRSAGNGRTKARTRSATNATVADTARHRASLKPAPTSRRPPNERQIIDCTVVESDPARNAAILQFQGTALLSANARPNRDFRGLARTRLARFATRSRKSDRRCRILSDWHYLKLAAPGNPVASASSARLNTCPTIARPLMTQVG